jgi:predicted deacylase
VVGRGKKTVLLLAGLAGDEPGGETLLEALRDRLTANPGAIQGVTMVIVPACNPDALEKETRLNANGKDINVNFPSQDRESKGKGLGLDDRRALLEPETMAVLETIEEYAPDLVISLHSSGGCIDHEGPEGLKFATLFSRSSGLPVRGKGSRSGSLGAFLALQEDVSYFRIELEYRHKRGVMPSAERHRFMDAFMDLFQLLALDPDTEILDEVIPQSMNEHHEEES